MVFNALAGTTKEYFTKIPVINSEMENVSTSQLTDGHTKYFPYRHFPLQNVTLTML